MTFSIDILIARILNLASAICLKAAIFLITADFSKSVLVTSKIFLHQTITHLYNPHEQVISTNLRDSVLKRICNNFNIFMLQQKSYHEWEKVGF